MLTSRRSVVLHQAGGLKAVEAEEDIDHTDVTEHVALVAECGLAQGAMLVPCSIESIWATKSIGSSHDSHSGVSSL